MDIKRVKNPGGSTGTPEGQHGTIKRPRGALRGIASAISSELVLELGGQGPPALRGPDTMGATNRSLVDLILPGLSVVMADRLDALVVPDQSAEGSIESRLRRIEERLLEILPSGYDNDEEPDAPPGRTDFPNLKYAKPKYKTVDSILKYVESQDEAPGIKLVIMNFND